MQNLNALVAITIQSHQYFEIELVAPNLEFNLKA